MIIQSIHMTLIFACCQIALMLQFMINFHFNDPRF